MIVYEVIGPKDHIGSGYETKSLEEAMELAEVFGYAQLITWAVYPNLPHAKPDLVYQSCALRVWNGETWKDCNIHGG